MFICGELCKAFARLVKRRDKTREGTVRGTLVLSTTSPFLHFYFVYLTSNVSISLPPYAHPWLCIYFYPSFHVYLSSDIFFLSLLCPRLLSSSIWPQHLCARFCMRSYASHAHCLCTDCTLISCNMVPTQLLFMHIIKCHFVVIM